MRIDLELAKRFPWLVENVETRADDVVDTIAGWYDESKKQSAAQLLSELERRFPSLGTDYDNVDMGDQWDALVEWHAELVGPGYVPKPADCPHCGEFVGNSGICADCMCTACGRESLACSVDPCAAVQRDREAGAVSLPLLAFQACAAIGLVSGVAAVVSWAQGVIGGLL